MSRKKKTEVETVEVPRGEIAKAVLHDQEESSKVLAYIRDELAIDSPETYLAAGEALKTLAQGHDQLKGKRDGWTSKLMEVVNDIRDTFNPAIKAYAEAEALLKGKIAAYSAVVVSKRAELVTTASKAYSEGDTERGTQALEAAKAFDLPEIPGVGVKAAWTGELVDGDALIDAVLAGKLGREYIQPNVGLCEKVTQNKGADPAIPGWRAFLTASVRTSRKG